MNGWLLEVKVVTSQLPAAAHAVADRVTWPQLTSTDSSLCARLCPKGLILFPLSIPAP